MNNTPACFVKCSTTSTPFCLKSTKYPRVKDQFAAPVSGNLFLPVFDLTIQRRLSVSAPANWRPVPRITPVLLLPSVSVCFLSAAAKK